MRQREAAAILRIGDLLAERKPPYQLAASAAGGDGRRPRARSEVLSFRSTSTSTRSCATRCEPRSRSCTPGRARPSSTRLNDQARAMADRIAVPSGGVSRSTRRPLTRFTIDPLLCSVAGFTGSPAHSFAVGFARRCHFERPVQCIALLPALASCRQSRGVTPYDSDSSGRLLATRWRARRLSRRQRPGHRCRVLDIS